MQQSKVQNSQASNSYDQLTYREKIIFLSGVFDGEGSFGMWSAGKGKKRILVVKVETTDADMVARFKEMFGGIFFATEARQKAYKNSFTWKVVRRQAWKTLEQMIPYMCLRRRQKYDGLVEFIEHGCEDRSSHLQKQTRVKEVNK